MEFIEVIERIGGSLAFFSAIGGGIWFLANWNSKKTKEQATADSAVAEVDGKVADNWERFSHRQQEQIEKLEDKIDRQGAKIGELYKRIGGLEDDLIVAECNFCDKIECKERNPPYGMYRLIKKNRENREKKLSEMQDNV